MSTSFLENLPLLKSNLLCQYDSVKWIAAEIKTNVKRNNGKNSASVSHLNNKKKTNWTYDTDSEANGEHGV